MIPFVKTASINVCFIAHSCSHTFESWHVFCSQYCIFVVHTEAPATTENNKVLCMHLCLCEINISLTYINYFCAISEAFISATSEFTVCVYPFYQNKCLLRKKIFYFNFNTQHHHILYSDETLVTST